jgi:hypothetical protein
MIYFQSKKKSPAKKTKKPVSDSDDDEDVPLVHSLLSIYRSLKAKKKAPAKKKPSAKRQSVEHSDDSDKEEMPLVRLSPTTTPNVGPNWPKRRKRNPSRRLKSVKRKMVRNLLAKSVKKKRRKMRMRTPFTLV